MTVKELSEFTGKRETTVRNWVRKAAAKNAVMATKVAGSNSTHPADYNIEEVEFILNESSLGQNAVFIVMENAKKTTETKAVATADMSAPLVAFMAQMQKQQEIFMQAVLEKLDRTVGDTAKPKMIEAPEQDFRSMLRQIVIKYSKKHTGSDVREAWGVLYEELYYRCHVSIRRRAANSGRSKLDEIEKANLLESAYLIMVERMGE